MKYKVLTEDLQNDFKYVVDHAYDEYFCNDPNCGCQDGSDYCRCAHYENLRVEEISNANLGYIRKHFLSVTKKKKAIEVKNTKFVEYCVDRLLRIYKVYDKNNWEISASQGYYGDEVDCVSLNCFNKIQEDLREIIKLSPTKRIEFILMKEYGHLLEDVKGKRWVEKEVPVSSIKINQHYCKKVDGYELTGLPVGIYLRDGDNYRLIDGYHRYVSLVASGAKKALIITTTK